MNTVSNKYLKAALTGLSAAVFASCADWLVPEPVIGNNPDYNDTVMSEEDEAYFAALREWKATPGLPQTFVWFDSWSGSSNTGSESLRALPDSVTIASNWGLHGADTSKFDLSDARKYDMEVVQKLKGTKVVVTFFSRFPGEGLPRSRFPHWYDDNGSYNYLTTSGNSTDEALVRPYIRQYAEDLYRACIETGYDGYDWDYEPGYGMDAPGGRTATPFYYNETQIRIFCEEMSYWFGPEAMNPERDRGGRPMPEKRLLFLIDGAVGSQAVGGYFYWMPAEYFDYYILQAYGGGNLQGRTYAVIKDASSAINAGKMTPEEVVGKTILTENFESYAGSGGGVLNMSSYVYNYYDHTGAQRIEHQIGGFGIYRVGFDYDKGTQKWTFLEPCITNLYKIWRVRNPEYYE